MFCKNCGNQIADGVKFCDKCGASQEVSTANTVENVSASQTPVPKNNKNLRVVIIAAIAVVCFAIGAFVIAPSFTKDTDSNNDGVFQSQNADNEAENTTDSSNASETDTQAETLKAIDGGYNQGKMFLSDMGEYGKVSLSVGYNPENGVIRQVTAAFTITVRHSEYESMKQDFKEWESKYADSDDKNIEISYVELSESVSCVMSLQKLYESDRAERVALAEEILDFVADEKDTAFYIDDITTLLVDTYGFEVQN